MGPRQSVALSRLFNCQERAVGIEPTTTAWKAGAIPFCNARMGVSLWTRPRSGRPDLNRRPPRPKRGALAICATPREMQRKYTAVGPFRQGFFELG
jgi:hypothetical protein